MSKVKLVCYDVHGNAFAVARAGNGSVAINPLMSGRPEQLWLQDSGSGNFCFRAPDQELYLNFVKDNAPCIAAQYDPTVSAWNPVQSGQSPSGQPTYALRPIKNIDGQNLNALKGSYSGDAVGTWGWGGGENNEVWEIIQQAN